MSEALSGDGSGYVRLSVNVDPVVLGEVREYAARKEISVTEATRRAFSALLSIDGFNTAHERLYLEKDGKLHEVMFLA
jgi:hypothetical protein